MPQIPDKLVNYRAYRAGGVEFLGTTDLELPQFQVMTETISGAGIAGEYDSPTLGHFQAMTLKLKWRAPTEAALGLLGPTHHALDLRGAVQIQDSTAGALVTQALRIEVRGQCKTFNLGKFEAGKPMDLETEIEVAAITIYLDDVKQIELDKFNQIFRVGATDYLRAVRRATGGV